MKIADSGGGGGGGGGGEPSLVRIPQAYSAMENPSRTLGGDRSSLEGTL